MYNPAALGKEEGLRPGVLTSLETKTLSPRNPDVGQSDFL